jgi:hypothetical protein
MSTETFRRFVRPPLSLSSSSDNLEVTSHRDRTIITLSDDQTEIRDFSGDIGEASLKIPELFAPVLELLSVTEIQSYEIKFLLEYQDPGVRDMGKWLGERVLNDHIATTLGTDITCGLVDVGFARGRKFQGLGLRIASSSTVKVSSRAIERAERLPDHNDFESELVAQYDDLLDTLRRLALIKHDSDT